jgi:hypothetical protein
VQALGKATCFLFLDFKEAKAIHFLEEMKKSISNVNYDVSLTAAPTNTP